MLTFDYKPYIGIVGDIVGSSSYDDDAQYKIQKKFLAIMDEINSEYENDISAVFWVTLGDEFQGLLHSGSYVVEIIEKIEREMYPVLIRFGIGVGKITTEIFREYPLKANGSAYKNARKYIEKLKLIEKKNKVSKSTYIAFEIDNHEEISAIINAVYSLVACIKSKWTQRQREIVYTCEKNGGTQNDVAKRLGINQSNVNKALIAADYYAYRQALYTVSQILSQIKEK